MNLDSHRAAIASALLAAAMGWASGSPAARGAEDAALSPVLAAHCFECHADGAREGNFALDELLTAKPSPATRDQWRKAWKMLRQEFMPPPDAEPLDAADRKDLTRWIEEARLGVDYDHPDPGRVTMRRLNRMEYEFTIHDMFDLEIAAMDIGTSLESTSESHLRDMLPPDDTAYGFDNIGDFQSMSPALLEKYFEIAELVVDNVIISEGPWYPTHEIEGSEYEVEREDEPKKTTQTATFELERPGHYRVDISFYLGGWQEYGGGYDFSLTMDGREHAHKAIDVGGQETHSYVIDGELEAGKHEIVFANVAIKEDSEGKLQHLRLNPRVTVTGPIAEGESSFPESHQRIFFEGPAPEDSDARLAYAKAILKRVADRAFRRPIDDLTLDRLAVLAMADENFERGIGHAMVAILTSPRFLFRTELQPQPDDPKSVHELDDYALASRLSYLLWLSLPDAELSELASQGKLRENVREQLARMLADPKSERFLEDFAGQWLRTRNVLMTPISRRDEIDSHRGDLKRETDMLFEHVVRADRDLMEIVTADYTFLNSKLAKFYDLPAVKGREFRRVELGPESHRGGILTQGSFLTATSNPDRTSLVKRGLFVLENLLATQPPAPPANVPALEDAHVEGKELVTVRQQLEAHRADPACAACHAHFDPIGMVLENYDLIGQWRKSDRGEPIDPTSTTISGAELAGIDDLRKYIVDNEERYYRCCTEKLMTYALGRGLEPYDAVTIDRITGELMTEGGKFSTLLTAVVESPAFGMRRGDDANDLLMAPRVVVPEIPAPDKRRPKFRRGRFNQFERQRNGNRENRERENRERDDEAENDEPEAERRPDDDADEAAAEPVDSVTPDASETKDIETSEAVDE